MHFAIPPTLLYAIGAVLIVFGALRAYHLGWKHKPASAAPGEPPESTDLDEAPAWDRERGYKRHITFGVLWMVLGLFLIISTIVNSRG